MAQILSGREVASAMNDALLTRAGALAERGILPTLAIVRVGENESDLSYERGAEKRAQKVGVGIRKLALPGDVGAETLLETIRTLNDDDSVHGVLLLRPLPEQLKGDSQRICNALRPDKDVDAMTDLSSAGVYQGRSDLGFPPCTPEACMKILHHYGISCAGKRAVVIGRSLVVGRPLAMMLMGEDATVTLCHSKTPKLPEIARQADILVTAAGRLGFVDAGFVRPGQVVLDVSVNWDPEKNGIAGDCVFDQAEPVVSAITPVPGGVGAVTSSVLMDHVISAAERRGL